MIFYRFGDIPEDECSSIWNNNNEVIGKEKGVSVYEAHKNIMEHIPLFFHFQQMRWHLMILYII
ncbi:MAG: hypothetical protein [Bacteriophage sp.]|nr:MAG: hypothetical protein [Bacteriophage sp.]